MLVANLANASRYGSIAREIEAVTADLSSPVKTSYSETKAAEANAFGFVKGGLSHTGTFQLPQGDPLERSFAALRELAGDKTCCLVLDNLETIFSNEKLIVGAG